MSIEIVLSPRKATKEDLKNHLVELGFESCESLWNWSDNSLHFWLFEKEEYKSFDGVVATIYPRSDKEKEEYPEGDWSLHTRTRSSESAGDQENQNLVIRTCGKKFGGDFYNDW